MEKIISLFERDYKGNRQVYNAVTPGAEWVIAGEGIATRKWDGTCCLVRDKKLYRRYEVRAGKQPPVNFEPATPVDPNTGKQYGWVPVGEGPADKYHREAFVGTEADGTYELVGPMIQGNAENMPVHILLQHGKCQLTTAPRTFDGLKEYFSAIDIEGIVWWHPDGRKVKIKAKDFGIRRKHETNNRR
jgi:hypothetical protein